MSLYNYNPGAGKYVWDSFGWGAQNNWVHTDDNDKQSGWKISGETIDADDAYNSSTFWDSAEAAAAAMGAKPAGPTASENAYAASLAAMGIDPSELPYGQVGQEATARVLQQHKQPLPAYLTRWLAGQPAGGGQGAQPPGLFSQPPGVTNAPPGAFGAPSGAFGGDIMTNNAAGAHQGRIADQQKAMLQKLMKMLGVQGGAPKSPISPALIQAAMGVRRAE